MKNQTQKTDNLFLQSEFEASCSPASQGQNSSSLNEGIQGLVSEKEIESRLNHIKGLDVDNYIEETVQPAQHAKRPGAKAVIDTINGKVIREIENGPLYAVEIVLAFPEGDRRVGIIAQERTVTNGAWMPEHHKLASEIIRQFAELSLPIVFFIDTPGADAGEQANSGNQAHSISQMIAESTNVDVPTVGIILGIGYSGGAIPLAATNTLLSVRDGIFNTIQPQGLQSIARKFNLSWQECAKEIGVSPEELKAHGCIDGIIDYSPTDIDERRLNLQKAIISSITAIEKNAAEYVQNTPEIHEHYQLSLERYLNPTDYQKALENYSPMNNAKHPTTQPHVFGLSYRHLRYINLRRRIHSSNNATHTENNTGTAPKQGDLSERLRLEQNRVFQDWLSSPDKLIYDDELAKAWKHFQSKRDQRGAERNAISRFILGAPEDNYEHSAHSLLFKISFSLYNRWKNGAVNNFNELLKLLADEDGHPSTNSWPQFNQLNIMDVVLHSELRPLFLEYCQNVLFFDALYDKVVSNLALISKEAMEHKKISYSAVKQLLDESLSSILSAANDDDEELEQMEKSFETWLRYFLGQASRGALLAKVETWKSIGSPHMNESLFVVLTYYFERLLPEFYSAENAEEFKGEINPVRIGRRKDFWNRLTMGYRDLLIQGLLREEKKVNAIAPDDLISHFFDNFAEFDADKTSGNPVEFPGFNKSIQQALEANKHACGLVTGVANFRTEENTSQAVAVAVSNVKFQAGAFDMAAAEKFCHLLIEAAKQRIPVVCFINSGGMQTKEGAAALFSMAIVNDRITRFIRATQLPVLMFGYGDCTGGAQASFVTHPMAQTFYFSGTNMPFAGQMVVPSYLPSTSTLSNYLSHTPGSMAGLVEHPFSAELDNKLAEIDPKMPLPEKTVKQAITEAFALMIPDMAQSKKDEQVDPRSLMKPVDKVLIHARGCTAVKLIRKAHESNINVVLTASDPDMQSVPAKMLKENDKLICIGGNSSDESYLNANSILKVAEYENVAALHPGIGFLSENPNFASLCVNHGVNFVGPSSYSMTTMGDKSNAIHTVQDCNVPVVPGSHGILSSAEHGARIADEMGYPVLLKAAHGGGGKGIQVVENRDEMFTYFSQISTEARAAFGNGDLYLEKFITSMRHIELQLLRDKFGNTHVLGLRDCSVQRNNQKVVEESGSTMLPENLFNKAFEYARAIANKVDYIGAGTVEFIYDLKANSIYFMEMNTRLQVEHPVTEATSGIDIVKAQFDIASGRSIENLEPTDEGYAIEVRVTAEKVSVSANGDIQLAPNPGKITKCVMPERDDVEVISIADSDIEISPFYDSLIAQIICRGKDRNDVIEKLISYLDSCVIEGISTNISLLKRILGDSTFVGGIYDTSYLPKFMASLDVQELIAETEAAANLGNASALNLDDIKVLESNELKVIANGSGVFYSASSPNDPDLVKPGDIVTTNQALGLVEAMKMYRQISLNDFNDAENELYPSDTKYRIEHIVSSNGQQITNGDLLFIVSKCG